MNQLYNYFRIVFTAALCFFFALSASAQQSFAVRGIIFKKNSAQAVGRVTVTDLKSKAVVVSDDLGDFSIQAAMGDTLRFKKEDYASQTITVQSKADITVSMQPNIILNEVTIRDITRKQELNDVLNDYKRTGQYYTLNPSAWSVMNSPLTGLYELFGKSPAEAKRFRQYMRDETEQEAVNKRYNKKIIQQVVNLPDSDVDAFMLAFTPSYEDIKTWSDYDIIIYIKRSFTFFENNKSHMKIETLSLPANTNGNGK